jgi:hypothetical protein
MNILLIVDIQMSMGHWFPGSYLSKIENFLRKNRQNYDAIYMIMEPVMTYEGSYKDGKYTAVKADELPNFLLDYLSLPPFYKAYNKFYWEQLKEEGQTKDEHFLNVPTFGIDGFYPMYENDGIRNLLEQLKSATNVDIIGGGLTKCVELTYKLLEFKKIPFQVLEKLCYEIRYVNTNRRDENTFLANPIKSIHPRLLNTEGKFATTEQPLIFSS